MYSDIEGFEDIDNEFGILESDNEHVIKFIDGFESIISQMESSGSVCLSGCENYTIGVFKANGIKFSPYMGSENFIVDAAKKLYEMITNMLKSIWNFFFGKGEDTVSTKDDSEVIKDKDEKIKKAGKIKTPENLVNTTVELTKEEHFEIIKDPEKALEKAKVEKRKPVKTKADKAKQIRNEVIADVARQVTESSFLNELKETTRKVNIHSIDSQLTSLELDDFLIDGVIEDEVGSKDSVAIGALKTLKTKYDEYISFVNKNEENLFMDIGQWSGHYQTYHDLKTGNTNRAIASFIALASHQDGLESALERDIKNLEKRKEILKEKTVREEDRKDITAAARAIKMQAELLSIIKKSLKKLQKIQKNQLAKIEKEKSKIIVKCIMLKDRKELHGRI